MAFICLFVCYKSWLLSLTLPSLHLTVETPEDVCEFRFWEASVAAHLCVTRKLNRTFLSALIESQITFPLSAP